MQDPNPLPWGAQDRFQAHFIVQQDTGDKVVQFTARTRLKTTGNFGSKKLIGVTWEGGKLAEDLNADSSLNEISVNATPNEIGEGEVEKGDYYSRCFSQTTRMVTNKGSLKISGTNIDAVQIIQKG